MEIGDTAEHGHEVYPSDVPSLGYPNGTAGVRTDARLEVRLQPHSGDRRNSRRPENTGGRRNAAPLLACWPVAVRRPLGAGVPAPQDPREHARGTRLGALPLLTRR